ncbi:MAG: DUF3370 family protein, partial [Cyanobacteria bacterium]|nr:DUF3370 family protein [Cyanobacteria bacterium CG_2015-09_32_10]
MLDILSFFIPLNLPIIYSQNITQNSEIISEDNNTLRPLQGKLNKIPVFNSNSPELVLGEGILLSTFPQDNKTYPEAHLNFAFQGRFDIFAHHVAKPPTEDDKRTLYLGIIIHNPNAKTVTIKTFEAASYLSQPDAPFITLPSKIEGSNIYAGPGSRVMGDILLGKRQEIFPPEII